MFNIFASLAEFERDIIGERTRAGLEAAKTRCHKSGRKFTDSDKISMALKMYDSKQCSIPEILKATGMGKTTLYRHIKGR